MEAFNLSMLGEQCWKLLNDPNSLLTRILKAKYFPKKGFLEADIGHNPSFTWRSIWSSQNLIKVGYRWKIGNGSQINAWTSPWIRSLPTLKSSTIPPPNTQELFVKDLLNPDFLSWNLDFIHSIFNLQDVAAILSMPLRGRNPTDTYVWNQTVDGAYSVKSAYNLCMNMAADQSHNDHEVNHDWNLIWKQSIPPKVRAFLWLAAHCCLPTRHNLAQKGIPCEDDCVHCDVMAKTHTHLFFVCLKAMDCWARVQLDATIRDLLLTVNDFTTLFFNFLDRLNPQHKSLGYMILWSLWKNRNNKLWEATDAPPFLIMQRAKDYLGEWSYIQRARQPHKSTPSDFPWTKPPIPYLKCNVDCALFNNNTITSFGFCFRDSTGHFVTGISNYSHSATSPPEAEALGLFEAIQFVIGRDMTYAIFETYCKLVVDLVYSPIVPQNEIGDIIILCKHLLSVHNSYVVRHTRRQANKVAYTIARASLSHPSPYIFDYVPDHFYSLIINEMD